MHHIVGRREGIGTRNKKMVEDKTAVRAFLSAVAEQKVFI